MSGVTVFVFAFLCGCVCGCVCVFACWCFRVVVFVCVCVSQTLFQREVNLCFQMFDVSLAGGHRKPIELCPTKLSMVSSRYQG